MTFRLFAFEAIESRIASYSCPPGTPGRLQTLRLRRYFQTETHLHRQNHNRRSHYSTIPAEKPRESTTEPIHHNVIPQRDSEYQLRLVQQEDVNQGLSRRRVTIRKYISLSKEYRGVRRKPKRIYRPLYDEKVDKGMGVFGLAAPEPYAQPSATQLEALPDQHDGSSPTDPVLRDYLAEAEKAVWSAMRRSEPHGLVSALMELSSIGGDAHTATFIQSLSPTAFSEMLRALDPQHLASNYHKFMEQSSPSYSQLLNVVMVDDGSYAFSVKFLNFVYELVMLRVKTSGLSLMDFKYLLKAARASGHGAAAEKLWHRFTKSIDRFSLQSGNYQELVPDVECYNNLMGSMLWQDKTHPYQRNKLRVIPDNFQPRQWVNPPRQLRGHHLSNQNGIRAKVSLLFQEMVQRRIAGNEETFCLMIVALAREGDIEGISNILKRVWAVDVPALVENDDVRFQRTCNPGSPIYPSHDLLFAIAHSFGANNDIPRALRLVDYISRKYSIPIPLQVWEELFQWTYVLSSRQSYTRKLPDGTNIDTGTEIGQLPEQAVANLWQTMISEPYNVKPTMAMYDRLISSLLKRKCFREAEIHMLAARTILANRVRSFSKKYLFLSLIPRHSPPTPLSFYKRKEFELAFARLEIRRHKEYVRRWVRRFISSASREYTRRIRNDNRTAERWLHQVIPRFVEDWDLFLPRKVEYRVLSGMVELKSGVNLLLAKRMRRRFRMRPGGRRRVLEESGVWLRESGGVLVGSDGVVGGLVDKGEEGEEGNKFLDGEKGEVWKGGRF